MGIPYGRVLGHPCPDCGSAMVLRRSRYGPFYGCRAWPRCDCTHGAHKSTGEPLGTSANARTRKARMRAHAAFDPLWKSHRMSRGAAYRWLAQAMGRAEVHIGDLSEAECDEVVRLCASRAPRGRAARPRTSAT